MTTIWRNVSENGPFFTTTFSRPFKDQSGAWGNGTSFGLNDVDASISVAHEASEWIAAHVLRHRYSVIVAWTRKQKTHGGQQWGVRRHGHCRSRSCSCS